MHGTDSFFLIIHAYAHFIIPTGQSFIIDKDGAVLGRKATNTIPLLMKVRLHIQLRFFHQTVDMSAHLLDTHGTTRNPY